MIITKIEISDFRNIEKISFDPNPFTNFLIGRNGQGKTNIIESIYYLIRNESFRYGDNQTFIKSDKQQASLKFDLEAKNLKYNLLLTLESSKKFTYLNQKKTTPKFLTSAFPIVLFSPESLSIIKESDEQRRRLIDELIQFTYPQGSELISSYRKVLRSRNRILKDCVDGKSDFKRTIDLIDSINPSFLRAAVDLTIARINSIKGLQTHLNEESKAILGENVDISVDYVISNTNHINSHREVVDNALQKRVVELRDAEIKSGLSLVGPHKHDLTFLYNQKDSRFFCSQGQQRALILAFKMAQIVYHRKIHGNDPILLLDDVLSELDGEKREALILFIQGLNSQCFVTSTEIDSLHKWNQNKSTVYDLKNGKIFERANT